MSTIFTRPFYIKKVSPFIQKELIKVIVGQRRVGKSYLLKQIQQEISDRVPHANFVQVDMEQMAFSFIKNYEDLHEYVESKQASGKPNFLFIDEIQEIAEFEKCLRSLQNSGNWDIYITGSNANLLSGELVTMLSGRFIEIQVHSLSYAEFLNFNQLNDNPQSLNQFLELGGLPYLFHLNNNKEVVMEYQKSIFNSILLKDVVAREGIRNVYFLENLVAFLADNTGSLVTAQNISKYLKSQKVDISTQTVLNYLNALTKAFLIYKVPRADVKGMKVFEVGEKYYFEDLGIRQSARRTNTLSDVEKRMENVVYIHLRRCGYQVFVGQLNEKEIDFVAEKANQKLYIQVSYTIAQEKTAEREFGNLLEIQNNYPKYVVTLDEYLDTGNYQGIAWMHLRQFLKEEW